MPHMGGRYTREEAVKPWFEIDHISGEDIYTDQKTTYLKGWISGDDILIVYL